MRTVITSSENSLTARFDKRFGRAAWFCLFDEETQKVDFLENENFSASNGAGIKTAEKMIVLGARKVISGDFGPKAKELLEKFNVQLIIVNDEETKIEDIIKKLKK